MRKLASVHRIWSIEPIEGADQIEMARVLGWQCVVNKGTFKPLDLGIYFEIDSFLPIRPEFEFLRSSSYKSSKLLGEGFRLRTMKFKGQISQGLLLPLSAFPELPDDIGLNADVTELLGVRKWEIEERASTGGTMIGTLPNGVPKTDETRVQSQPELLGEFSGIEYYISTKMDGTSCSVSVDADNNLHVMGHNYEYKDDGKSLFYEYVKKYGIGNRLIDFKKRFDISSIVLQGEFCAPGIQKNRLKLQKPDWYVFTVIIEGERIGLDSMRPICGEMSIKMVPIEEIGMDLPSKYPTVESLLERADGEYPNGGRKEGIVIRPTTPIYSPTIGAYLSMKVVNNKYLLKNE